jgi:CRP-like cAMP-binding protein
LCFVNQADFDAFGKSNPEIYRDVMKVLARRLRDTNNVLAASSFLAANGAPNGGERILAILGPGSVVGELSSRTCRRRPCSVSRRAQS